MNEIIAASKAKCRNKACRQPVVRVQLLPGKGYIYIDQAPVESGRVVVVTPGILGDKKSPCQVAYVSRSLNRTEGDRYQIHACPEIKAA